MQSSFQELLLMKCLARHLKNWVSLWKNCHSNLKAGNSF
ncbi:hypothetical protein Goshw_023696 [Gossypium schwendimanii]|uniref:Uncharacterized protein n=1 Tax=Gossypium schwendimanii TaxID=34291 RepID=A0A7J9KYW0_GOSSC|nr:hypothetical protein [Gossypium schwendimanii]